VGRVSQQSLSKASKGWSMSRAISATFVKDLKNGYLSGLLQRIRDDDTLQLALRGSYINIYYRGGNILRLTEKSGSYFAEFNSEYSRDDYSKISELGLPKHISTLEECKLWLRAFPALKEVMNSFFARNSKPEREFQQLVAWENNRSAISNETEYFITDIEFADAEEKTRIDMLALKWRTKDRQHNNRCKPVFVEMKYGIHAYGGVSGIKAHLEHLDAILRNHEKAQLLNDLIATQFGQLLELGLVRFNQNFITKASIAETGSAQFDIAGKPEVIFLLANHNPRSTPLLDIINGIEEPEHFDLRFFNARFAGYGMHDACMLTLSEFKELLKQLSS
jgi:hypothetical protein